MGSFISREVEDKFQEIDSEFQTIEDSESQMVVQVCRKIKLLNDSKNYCHNGDQSSVYHKYMLGTKEYIGDSTNTYVYELYSTRFFSLYPWLMERQYDDIYVSLVDV